MFSSSINLSMDISAVISFFFSSDILIVFHFVITFKLDTNQQSIEMQSWQSKQSFPQRKIWNRETHRCMKLCLGKSNIISNEMLQMSIWNKSNNVFLKILILGLLFLIVLLGIHCSICKIFYSIYYIYTYIILEFTLV
jgi:hypothetical protein